MAVNLVKGQKVDLRKSNGDELKKVIVGLGWKRVEQKRGFFFGAQPRDIDCDASALLCKGGKMVDTRDVVYFGSLKHNSGAVTHFGDNLIGGMGTEDNEQVSVMLKELPRDYDRIIFIVNIYQARERRQHFGMIRSAFIRIIDADTKQELCRYNLADNYEGKTAMIVGEVYRRDGGWKFNAIGEATNDNSISEMYKRFV